MDSTKRVHNFQNLPNLVLFCTDGQWKGNLDTHKGMPSKSCATLVTNCTVNEHYPKVCSVFFLHHAGTNLSGGTPLSHTSLLCLCI